MPTNVVDDVAGKVITPEGPHIVRYSCVADEAFNAGDLLKYDDTNNKVIRVAATTDNLLGYAERRRNNGGAAADAVTFAAGEAVSVVALGSPCIMMVNAFGSVTRGDLAIPSATEHLVTGAGALPLAEETAGRFVHSRTGAGVVPVNLAGSA